MPEPFRPLTGITILAWEQAVSLPIATRLLADLGAAVIRLESHTRGARRPRHLGNDLARNKLSVAIDLRQDQGRQLARDLIRRVDIFCENYTPRVQRQFGLSYDELVQVKPDLIMLSLTGYGQTGTWKDRPSYGPGIESAAGHAMSIGYPDRPPTRPGTIVYADNISGFYAALALLGALHRRRATGKGTSIDLSMYEANVFHLGLSVLRSSLTGAPEVRHGNTDPEAYLQDVLPTREPERWLAVTVRRGQHEALTRVLDCTNADTPLSESLRRWAAARTAEDAAAILQTEGIAASPVLTAKDVLLNPQLRHRAAFTLVRHEASVNGYTAHPHGASPWRVADRPRPELREAPAVGEDTRAVLSDRLGLSDAEIDALIAAGVVGVPSSAAPASSGRRDLDAIQKQLDRRLIAGYDPDHGAVLGLPRDGAVP
jgi:crotonobetainyl-CoA:carnitine CoA-transferase CaiB-like acyl-CoA transferase